MIIKSIKYRIVIPLVTIVICVGIAILCYDYFMRLNSGEKQYKEATHKLLRNIEEYIAHNIVIHGQEELKDVIEDLKENETDIAYVFVLNDDNNIIAHTFESDVPSELLNFNMESEFSFIRTEVNNQDIYDFSYPIHNGTLGIIRVGRTSEKLDGYITNHLIYLIIIFLIWTIIGVSFSLFVTGRVTRSIKTLLKSVNKIAYGDFNERIPVSNKGEIGDLAISINFMADSLQIVKEELEEKITALETKNQDIELINLDLQLAKNKAEESDRLKTEFLNNISHEIRTPMNAISGFTGLLLKPTISDEQKNRYISIINSSTLNLLDIINDIISISEINAGIVEKSEEDINLPEMLENIHKKYEIIATGKQLKFNLITKNNIPSKIIHVDYLKLDKIINCLITNAVKFTKEGEVSFGYELKNKHLEFFVKDTGIGIDNQNRDDVFKHFKKIKSDPTKLYSGMGLGLAITKAYVELLGGKIWFNSRPQNGSEFYFNIPASFVMQKQENQKLEVKLPDINTEDIILIVEDEKMNYLYLVELLENIEAKIIRAKSGEEAQKLFEEYQNIRLILMDIKLPDINGYDLTKQFKATRPDVPIIAQTAYAMQGDRSKSFDSGCDDYISKPINITEFHNMISKYISVKD